MYLVYYLYNILVEISIGHQRQDFLIDGKRIFYAYLFGIKSKLT